MPILYSVHCRSLPTPSDGTRILVMRYWPRGVKKGAFDEWIRELSPSPALLQQARSIRSLRDWINPPGTSDSVVWADAFRAEMRLQAASIERLRRRHECGETLTLLCSCHDANECHRSILAAILREQSGANR